MARRNFVPIAAAILMSTAAAAKATPVPSAKTSQSETIVSAPYGANTLVETDEKQLTNSLAAQITSAGLAVPPLNLFPTDTSPDHGHTTIDDDKVTSVAGLSQGDISATSPNIISRLNGGLYTSEGQCSSAMMLGLTKEYSVMIALHETTHAVAQELGLNQSVPNAINEKRDAFNAYQKNDTNTVATADVNIKERMADAGAVLYVLSNYKNRADNNRAINAFLTDRQLYAPKSISGRVDDHYTSSSVIAAVKAFDKNPRKNISIVESTKWAAEIVKNQPLQNLNINADINISVILEMGGDPKKPTTETVGNDPQLIAQIKSRTQEAIKARNLYCRVSPGM